MNLELNNIIKSMPYNELKELSIFLSSLLLENTNEDNEAMYCPHCGCKEFIKYGKYKGMQRYKCSCGKTFCSNANKLNYCSKISKEKWMMFIDYEIAGLSLNEISYFTGLSVTTCFRLRHKLYFACERIVYNTKLNGVTELDAAYQGINLKGTKKHNMPRLSKKRGSPSTYSGISHHKLCIVIAKDEFDNLFIRIAGLGPESFEKYKSFEKNFKNSNLLISDSKTSIQQFANHLSIINDKIPSKPNVERYITDDGNNIQSVNQLCSEITSLINRTRGVNIRYLNGYLSFICIKKMFKYKYNRKDISKNMFNSLILRKKLLTKNIGRKKIPVDLKEAYWEFNYGIYKH